jgi:hypothetical protein
MRTPTDILSLASALAVALPSAGCRTVDPQAKSETEILLSTTRTETEELPDKVDKVPWAVGQWAKYKIVSGETPSVVRYSIVGQEGEDFWMEILNSDYYQSGYQKWLVSGIDPGDPRNIEGLQVKRVFNWSPKSGQKHSVEMPGIATGLAETALRSMALDISDEPGEAVSVPGGRFDSRLLKTDVMVLGMHSESDVWMNGAVPIWGIVKTAATDGSHRMELIDFGLEGAEAKVPDPRAGKKSPF